ncbi:MAG: hypothetical protein ACI81I_000369 [Arcobacteraceae bacterium]|jgi:hypothetical protein
MQKMKYIIIAILLLALGIIYLQLLDYKNITSILLKENTTLINKTYDLNDKIISLEESLSIKEIELNKLNFINNTTKINNLPQYLNPLNQAIQETEKLKLTPNITIDEENKITGFGLEYKQEF